MQLVRMKIKAQRAAELFTVVNDYLIEFIGAAKAFREQDIFIRNQKDGDRFILEAEREFSDFPMNELYQAISRETYLWFPGDSIRAVYLERIDPDTRQPRPYFDFEPFSIMESVKEKLKEFYSQNSIVDNSNFSNVNKEN